VYREHDWRAYVFGGDDDSAARPGNRRDAAVAGVVNLDNAH